MRYQFHPFCENCSFLHPTTVGETYRGEQIVTCFDYVKCARIAEIIRKEQAKKETGQ